MTDAVSVAIPVRNGGRRLASVLESVASQRLDRDVELIVADSGSTDGSPELARSFGATVVPVRRFSHGGTRNELMDRSHGAHVAFLTQDAVPATERWLHELLSGFEIADDVALAFGPYRPQPDAPVAVRRELEAWFGSLAADGRPRVDRTPLPDGPGPVTFFTDANAAIARAAWKQVPFRTVPYAEDQALAIDMLRAGYAKAFMPDAAVVHSHVYGPLDQFRRTFDEWRALREVHGYVQPIAPLQTLLTIQRAVRDDVGFLRAAHAGLDVQARELPRSVRHWTVRAVGAVIGSRADRLSPAVRGLCSLERRTTFESESGVPNRT